MTVFLLSLYRPEDQFMEFTPVATLHSPYRQKFAIPRQPGLVPEARGELIFSEPCADPNILRAIDQFSHLWLIFVFHETARRGWSPMVQPPRLGGRDRVGVFASRSTHRPNPIGLSVVRQLGWQQQGRRLRLAVEGPDLLDGTPILDIKPYLPWADSIPDAVAGYAETRPEQHRHIDFSAAALAELTTLEPDYPGLGPFITSVLRQDPRPAWHSGGTDERCYGMSLYDLNIRWEVREASFHVVSITRQND